MDAARPTGPIVTDLFVYPVKGCAGIRVIGAAIGKAGFVDDRRYMIVDENDEFVTQRTLPELCLFKLSIVDFSYRMSREGRAPFSFPRKPAGGVPRRVKVWSDHVEALEQPELSAYLSETLGGNYRGVYVPDAALRQVNPKRAREGDRVGVADGYPFLMVSRESLGELNRRLTQGGEAALDVRRFRPNIVIGGCAAPHEEDLYRSFSIGKVSFRMPKLCDRCVVTTVDPDTSVGGKEPLRTLASYRRAEGAVWFGVNLIHDGEGALRVGDAVSVRETGSPLV